jgi:hypothetical protein
MRLRELLGEEATGGSTSAGNIATVVSPNLAIGKNSAMKKWSGSPGKMGKSIKPPKTVQAKDSNGTAKNALDMKTSIFGGSPVKR